MNNNKKYKKLIHTSTHRSIPSYPEKLNTNVAQSTLLHFEFSQYSECLCSIHVKLFTYKLQNLYARLNIKGNYRSRKKDEHFQMNKTLQVGIWNVRGLPQNEDSWNVSVYNEIQIYLG
jgi:hypothetical protein